MKQKLIIIAGPTASGKSDISISIAQKLGGEIISADSMQVYRGMDIGSAKMSQDDMQGIPHHLIDILEPTQNFDIVMFQKLAKEAIATISRRKKIPIIVGGTGFYIQSVLYDIDFSEEEKDRKLRQELENEYDEKGVTFMYEKLKRIDILSAEKIHPHNKKRIVRAIEFFIQNGYPISAHNEIEQKKKPIYDAKFFVLAPERKILYARINTRVEEMLVAGLVEEVRRLKERGLNKTYLSMQGIGYKEVLSYLDGESEYKEMVELIKQNTRHFAKRQLTWFKREKEAIWVDPLQVDICTLV